MLSRIFDKSYICFPSETTTEDITTERKSRMIQIDENQICKFSKFRKMFKFIFQKNVDFLCISHYHTYQCFIYSFILYIHSRLRMIHMVQSLHKLV